MKIITGNKEKDKKRKEKDFDKEASQRKEKAKKYDGAPRLQFKDYTLLTKSHSTNLATIKGLSLIEFPKKTNKPMG